MPGEALRTAASTALALTSPAMLANEGSAQIGRVVRYRAGSARLSRSYQPTPNPSALTVPCVWWRGSRACWRSECFGSMISFSSVTVGPTYARWRHMAGLGVRGAAEAGEDLPPDRIVPVPERGAAHAGVACPGSTPQHLVLASEEHLGVLAVGERHEARVPGEVGGRPFPHVAEHLLRSAGLAVESRGRLPFGLGGEASVAPAGERVRLVPADVL